MSNECFGLESLLGVGVSYEQLNPLEGNRSVTIKGSPADIVLKPVTITTAKDIVEVFRRNLDDISKRKTIMDIYSLYSKETAKDSDVK